MSWMAMLYETYNHAIDNQVLVDHPDPYFHLREGCHIEIVITDDGRFISAKSLVAEKKYGKKTFYKKESTIIPITPKSLTGRTSGPAPYPLAEKIQYVAKDYVEYGGRKESYFIYYLAELQKWAWHDMYSHWKVKAVLNYVTKGSVVRDLVESRVLFVTKGSDKYELITKWQKQAEKGEKKPPLIQALTGGDQGNATVRWRVQKNGVADDTTWEDPELIKAWQLYASLVFEGNGFCQVLGKDAFITQTHPKAIYPQAVNAKLISTPTNDGYLTYQGRFAGSSQSVSISFEASQKAHSALRWLIGRGQGKTIGEASEKNRPSVVVAWAISGEAIPQPLDDIFNSISEDIKEEATPVHIETKVNQAIDLGQSFALKLSKYLDGFSVKLRATDSVVIMCLDTATDGRMAVTYYQEFFPDEYIDRISQWHNDFAWHQRHNIEIAVGEENLINKTVWSVCSPSPWAILEAIYSSTINEPLKKHTIERILPCIVEGRPFSWDLVQKAIHRVTNRSAYKNKQGLWEEHLGVACALYRGFSKRNSNKEYKMAVDENNDSRDYLFGCLLAVAERIEEMSMIVAQEKARSTHASRLMQRFSEYPLATWKTIEESISPYQQRLRNNIPPLESAYKRLLDDICAKFTGDDFTRIDKLTGEYLLGYHLQRKWLREHKLENGKWVQKTKSDDIELKYEGDE